MSTKDGLRLSVSVQDLGSYGTTIASTTVTIMALDSHGLSFSCYLIYLPFTGPVDLPVSPSLTSTTQTPVVCLRFYCSSLCIVSHPSFHTVDIPNALFHLLLYVPYSPRSSTDTLSHRPSFVDVPRVYKETPSLGSWALSLT